MGNYSNNSLKMHFYEKRIRIKVFLLIDSFQVVVPKCGTDIFLGLMGLKPSFLVQNSYFLLPIRNLRKILRSNTLFLDLKIGPYVCH